MAAPALLEISHSSAVTLMLSILMKGTVCGSECELAYYLLSRLTPRRHESKLDALYEIMQFEDEVEQEYFCMHFTSLL